MPVHTHYGSKSLKPEWVRQAGEEFGTAVVEQDGFDDCGPELGHTFGKPCGYATAVKRQICCARSSHIDSISQLEYAKNQLREESAIVNRQLSYVVQNQMKGYDQQHAGGETGQYQSPSMFDKLPKNRVNGQEEKSPTDMCQQEIQPEI